MKLEFLEEHKDEERTSRVWRIGDFYQITVDSYGAGENIHVQTNCSKEYLPEIYCTESGKVREGTFKREFEIQTSGYGTKSPEEIGKVIAGYELALEAASLLNEKFAVR